MYNTCLYDTPVKYTVPYPALVGVLAFFLLGVQPEVPGHLVASPPVLDKSVDLYNQGSWNCYSPFCSPDSVNVSGWTRVTFWLNFSNATDSGGPGGYLFVCPPKHLRTGPESFGWPQCAWFWSMDPNGDHPLTEQDARRFGLPGIQMRIEVSGRSWPSSVYEGLKTFHAAKGFDPESQELAQQLELPLLEVSGEGAAPLFSNGWFQTVYLHTSLMLQPVSDESQIFIPECLDPVGKQARQFARAERVLELVDWKKGNHQIAQRNLEKQLRFKADKVAWHSSWEQGNGPREELAKPRWKDYRPEMRLRRPIKMLNGEDWKPRGKMMLKKKSRRKTTARKGARKRMLKTGGGRPKAVADNIEAVPDIVQLDHIDDEAHVLLLRTLTRCPPRPPDRIKTKTQAAVPYSTTVGSRGAATFGVPAVTAV
ncbi:hypothetical protein FB45DRAFT_868653 [Roridomyces roridus]|uniref:Uncharacterized protein n=1 Tax=Roridomyces roridus TaxID=1738132 RepID=A0AAD7BQ93_9AGAR|nr:hypothetical protein FB45DRAFT_868653 [Roridomyces roridus]